MSSIYKSAIFNVFLKRVEKFLIENEKKIEKYIDNGTLISPELKVRKKDTGTLYTIDSISKNNIILRDPENNKIKILHHDLEDDFELA